jgi:hypothetical protein
VDFDRIERRIGDPRYISGIHNYCDAWCQRCEFATRCAIYVSPEDHQRELARLRMKSIDEELAKGALPELPPLPEPNIQPTTADAAANAEDEEDFKEFMEEEGKRDEAVRAHPISQAAWTYLERADAWLNGLRHLFNEEGELADDKVKAELRGTASDDDLLALEDAIEVIRWYHTLISAKAHRALHGKDDDDILDDDGTPFPRDCDGSAKVCLLGIDRSIEAWSTLRDLMPKRSEGVLDTLTLLNNLRHAMEEEFPNARAFVRPGFDEPLPPALPKRKRTPKQKGPRAGRPKRRKGGRDLRGAH